MAIAEIVRREREEHSHLSCERVTVWFDLALQIRRSGWVLNLKSQVV